MIFCTTWLVVIKEQENAHNHAPTNTSTTNQPAPCARAPAGAAPRRPPGPCLAAAPPRAPPRPPRPRRRRRRCAHPRCRHELLPQRPPPQPRATAAAAVTRPRPRATPPPPSRPRRCPQGPAPGHRRGERCSGTHGSREGDYPPTEGGDETQVTPGGADSWKWPSIPRSGMMACSKVCRCSMHRKHAQQARAWSAHIERSTRFRTWRTACIALERERALVEKLDSRIARKRFSTMNMPTTIRMRKYTTAPVPVARQQLYLTHAPRAMLSCVFQAQRNAAASEGA